MKKPISRYEWLLKMARTRTGIEIDGITFVPPYHTHHNCDGCWFLERQAGIRDDNKAYRCRAFAKIRRKPSGTGWKPDEKCLACRDATSFGPNRADALLEEIRRLCEEEDKCEGC